VSQAKRVDTGACPRFREAVTMVGCVNKLVLENLKHRPVRTLLSVIAVGRAGHDDADPGGPQRWHAPGFGPARPRVGADIWVKPPGSSVMSFKLGPECRKHCWAIS